MLTTMSMMAVMLNAIIATTFFLFFRYIFSFRRRPSPAIWVRWP
jgi:hypothetical protein